MSTQSSLHQAKVAASAGDSKAAIVILRGVLKQDPQNVDAWLALADIVENPDQAQQCLERVLQIDPNNQIAQQKLYGEQLDDFDFLFGMDDETAQEPEDSSEPVQELDFSKISFQTYPPQNPAIEQREPLDPTGPQMPLLAADEVASKKESAPKSPVKKKPAEKKKKGLSGIEIAMISVIGVLCLCIGFFGVAALGRNGFPEPEPTPLPADVTAVIYENIRASNAKDFDRYMATIHSKSPVYSTTERELKKAFSNNFTLSYRVSDVYIIEQSSNKAIVHFVLTTRLVSGSISFRDNRVTGEMELRTEDGVWKIYNQEVISVDYLD